MRGVDLFHIRSSFVDSPLWGDKEGLVIKNMYV